MAVAVEHSRRRFTADEYLAMADAGILHEDDPIELLDGDIVTMTPIGWPHVGTVSRLIHLFIGRLGDSVVVQAQSSLWLDAVTVLEPDLVVLRARADFYASDPRPTPDDVLLVVEVSDLSLRYDTTVKAAMYARTGYREYWVVDLNAEAVIRHTNPVDGRYLDVAVIPAEAPFAPLALPGCLLTLSNIFGARA